MIDPKEIMVGQRIFYVNPDAKSLGVGIVSEVMLGDGDLDPHPLFPDQKFRMPTSITVHFFGQQSKSLQRLISGMFSDSYRTDSEKETVNQDLFFESLEELIDHIGMDAVRSIVRTKVQLSSNVQKELSKILTEDQMNVCEDERIADYLKDLKEKHSFRDAGNVLSLLSGDGQTVISDDDTAHLMYDGPQLGTLAFGIEYNFVNSKVPIRILETWVSSIRLQIRRNEAPQIKWYCYRPGFNQSATYHLSLEACYKDIKKTIGGGPLRVDTSKIPRVTAKEEYENQQRLHQKNVDTILK